MRDSLTPTSGRKREPKGKKLERRSRAGLEAKRLGQGGKGGREENKGYLGMPVEVTGSGGTNVERMLRGKGLRWVVLSFQRKKRGPNRAPYQ